MAFMQQLI